MQAARLKEKSHLRLFMLERLEAPAIRTRRNVLMFLIPSLIGILLFMTPVIYDGNVTIPSPCWRSWFKRCLPIIWWPWSAPSSPPPC